MGSRDGDFDIYIRRRRVDADYIPGFHHQQYEQDDAGRPAFVRFAALLISDEFRAVEIWSVSDLDEFDDYLIEQLQKDELALSDVQFGLMWDRYEMADEGQIAGGQFNPLPKVHWAPTRSYEAFITMTIEPAKMVQVHNNLPGHYGSCFMGVDRWPGSKLYVNVGTIISSQERRNCVLKTDSLDGLILPYQVSFTPRLDDTNSYWVNHDEL